MEERYSNYYASPSNFPNTNSISYFAHQAIRVHYASPELRRRECYRNPDPSLGFRDSIQRELEKERIRAEIIAEEAFRRKLLEDEVRREMMMEREMSMRRGDGGERLLTCGSTMVFEHRENNNRGVRVPLLTNYEHEIGVSPYREIEFCESRMLPFQRDPAVAGNVDGSSSGSGRKFSSGVKLKEIKEIKGPAVEVMNKNKVFLAKPNATDLKRKATTPIAAPVDPSVGLKKPKAQDEWSCTLCRVTATSERALNDHLQGKKHKSRVSGFNSQRTGFGTGPLPKIGSHSLSKPIKVPGATYSPSLKKGRIGPGESSLGKVAKSASQKLPMINQKTFVVKGKIGKASVPQKPPIAKPENKFKYFCETCQVGVDKLKVMNAHKKGKRHWAKTMKLNKMNEIPAQKNTVEKKTVTEEPAIASCLEKGVVEEEKEMDSIVAKEMKIEREDKVESRKEIVDSDVWVEEDKDKVLEIDGGFVSVDKE